MNGDLISTGPTPHLLAHRTAARKYAFPGAVASVALVVDTVTKAWARHRLGNMFRKIDWGPFLTLTLRHNHGDSMGVLPRLSDDVSRVLFPLVAVTAIVVVCAAYRHMGERQAKLAWGYALVLGGAFGNLLDRLRFGYVTDFIDVHLIWGRLQTHSPTINVADVVIAVGAGLLALHAMQSRAPVGNSG